MVDSYNCLRLDNKDVFQVEVYKENKENDKQKYFKLDNGKILFENLKVGQLAKIIRSQEEFKVSKLWKVDVDKSKINPGSTDDDIKELGGELMEDEFDFIDYFPEDYKPTRKKIHIVAVVATTTTEPTMKKRRLWKEDPKKKFVIQGSSNEVRRPPISQSEFVLVRENNMLYMDKTYWLTELNLNCGYYFVSRPRKFGKSMFLSMIESFFLVQYDLFKGLYVYDNPPIINVSGTDRKWGKDLPSIPVIRLDFSKLTANEGPDVIKMELIQSLKLIGEVYGITLKFNTVKSVTEELVVSLADHEANVYRKVVILVDEYDSPILSVFNASKESLEIADKNHEVLKGFFEVTKAMQTKVKFLLVTGVSMFAQLGLFSGANHLEDVTISPELSGAYGFMEDEIRQTFESSLEHSEYSIEDLRKKYDGYSWDCSIKSIKVYNPYSICMFFNKFELENHWIQKGKTSFLAKLIGMEHVKDIVREITIKKRSIVPVNIEVIQDSFEPPVPLLFQTGYLTIKQQKVDEDKEICLVLDIPNTEVKESWMGELWANLSNTSIETACKRIQVLANLLKKDDFIVFMKEFNHDLASVPCFESQHAGKYEGYYHSHFHMLVRYIGIPFRSEDATSKGRTDMWIETLKCFYFIEFKRCKGGNITELIQEAINQIFDQQYYVGLTANLDFPTKTKYAVGCVCSTETRKICGIGIQEFTCGFNGFDKLELKNFLDEFSY